MSGSEALLAALWRTPLWRVLAVLFIYSFGYGTLVPVLPTIFTNFFASRHAGHAIACEGFALHEQPPACHEAHADVVKWTSWTSLVSNSFLSFLCAPLIGDLSDIHGRKPFVLLAFTLALLPQAVVFAYLHGPASSLLWYYPATALSGIASTIVLFLSYAADQLKPEHRTAGFGLIIAAFSLGFTLGPSFGAGLSPRTASGVALGSTLLAALLVLLAVPESLPPSVAAAAAAGGCAAQRRPRPLDAFVSLSRSWRLITSSALFKRLALCMAIVGVVNEGIQDMLVQYLQLTLGFNTFDQGLLFTILGASNLVVQGLLLPWLVPLLGERKLLLAGLLLSAAEQVMLALAAAKWQALAAVGVGSLAGVSWPAIAALKANNVGADQQGLVQGALAGIRALATGLGPLAFAQLFAACTRQGASLGYRPGLLFWCSCGLTLLAAAVALSIQRTPGGPLEAAGGAVGAGARRAPLSADSFISAAAAAKALAAVAAAPVGEEGCADVEQAAPLERGCGKLAGIEESRPLLSRPTSPGPQDGRAERR